MYFGMLISCFVHERKHRVIKKWAFGHGNTTSYELGMLEEVTVDQLQSLQDWQHVQGLTEAHPLSKRLKNNARGIMSVSSQHLTLPTIDSV